eukprot:3576435-Rhodomonas_salina.2
MRGVQKRRPTLDENDVGGKHHELARRVLVLELAVNSVRLPPTAPPSRVRGLVLHSRFRYASVTTTENQGHQRMTPKVL